MTTETFIIIMNTGEKIQCGSEVHRYMGMLSQEAMKITAKINCGYHEPEEIRELFSLLTGREVDESFGMFPPFYTDCGKNIHIGRNVFFNGGCRRWGNRSCRGGGCEGCSARCDRGRRACKAHKNFR